MEEIDAWFEGDRPDKQFNGKLRKEFNNWDFNIRQPKIKLSFGEIKGVKQRGNVLMVKTPSLYYNHVMYILTAETNIISEQYSVCKINNMSLLLLVALLILIQCISTGMMKTTNGQEVTI